MKTNPGSTSLTVVVWLAFLVVILAGLWLATGHTMEGLAGIVWEWLP